MCSMPTSLPTAVSIAVSATRLIAASAGRPAVIGCSNSTAMWAASQLEPPLPIENSRPSRWYTAAIARAIATTLAPLRSKKARLTATLSSAFSRTASSRAWSSRCASCFAPCRKG